MAGNDRDHSVVARFAYLPGYTTARTTSARGCTAELRSTIDPAFPWWFELRLRRSGGWTSPLPPELRLAGPLVWAPDGSALAVPAFRGIRLGVVLVEPDSGTWRWATPDDEASYVDPVPAAGGAELTATRVGLDGAEATVRLSAGADVTRAETAGVGTAADFQLLRWRVPDGELEGVLATPRLRPPSAGWPLVVSLHGGPVGALRTGEAEQLEQWRARGFAAFQPDFRGSGILGPEPMLRAFGGIGLPADDHEAHDVLSGVAAAVGTGLVDPSRLFCVGFSYGAYLLNRIVTGEHPFRAGVCWEGVADLRQLDPASIRMQSRWRGGSPAKRPAAWAAASPIEHAGRVILPMLLAYGEHGNAEPHGVGWHAALREHQVESTLVVYPGEGHVFGPDAESDLFDRAVKWFAGAV